MEQVIPYLPSARWYGAWLRRCLSQGGEQMPNVAAPNRTMIVSPRGEQTLTVPIEGGRRELLRTPWEKLRLSEHGNWRHEHREAIASAYGATPYYHHYAHLIEPIYDSRRSTLRELSMLLHLRLCRAAELPRLVDWLKKNPDAPIVRPQHPVENPDASALDLLFRAGPETIFYLLAL